MIFEYISSALPVLTYLDGVTQEYVEKYECGVKFDTADQLVTAVKSLMNDEFLRLKMSLNSRQLFDLKFDSKLVYERFSQHLERVALVY